MRCTNMERGCLWTGTIGTLNTHLVPCEFFLVPCPNKCEDVEDGPELQIVWKDLAEHLRSQCVKRIYYCTYCGEGGTYASITGQHDKVCGKKIVNCPNRSIGCILSMERGRIKQHVSVCEFTEVVCTYKSLGCGVKMMRKDIKKHEADITAHFSCMVRVVKTQSEKLKMQSELLSTVLEQYSVMSDQVNILSHLVRSLTDNDEGEAFVFQLTGFADKKENNKTFHSSSFYTYPGGYKIAVEVDLNGRGETRGTHVSVSARILTGEYDSQLQWPFQGTITYELLNQMSDDGHYKRMITINAIDDMLVGFCRTYPQFFPHSSLCHDPATNTQYLLDDTLYFRVSVKVDNHKPWLVCTDKINKDSPDVVHKGNLANDYIFWLAMFFFVVLLKWFSHY